MSVLECFFFVLVVLYVVGYLKQCVPCELCNLFYVKMDTPLCFILQYCLSACSMLGIVLDF